MSFPDSICQKLGLKLWREGKAFSIYYLTSVDPTAEEVTDSLDAKEGRMTRAFVENLAENKLILCQTNRSKQIEKNLFRFRTTNQLRLMCFRDGSGIFIITHAFIKKSNAIPPEEIAKAKRLREEHYQKKKELGL